MSKKQKIEKIFCVLIPLLAMAMAFACISFRTGKSEIAGSSLNGMEAVKTVMGIWATLLGFSITAESILIAIRGGEFISLMISSGHMKTILFSFMITNIFLFICLIIFIPVILSGKWDFNIYRIFICSLFVTFTSLGISLLYFFIILSSVEK